MMRLLAALFCAWAALPAAAAAADVSASVLPGDGSADRLALRLTASDASLISVEIDGRELLITFPEALAQVDGDALLRAGRGLIEGVETGYDSMLLKLSRPFDPLIERQGGFLDIVLAEASPPPAPSLPVLAPALGLALAPAQGMLPHPSQGIGLAPALGLALPSPAVQTATAEAAAADRSTLRLQLVEAQAMAQTGDADAARLQLGSVMAAAPDNPEAPAILAGLEQRRGRWRAARDLYERAGHLDPRNEDVPAARAAIDREQSSRARLDADLKTVKGGETVYQSRLGGHQLVGDGWRIGASLDSWKVEADQVLLPDGSVRKIDSLRQRGEVSLQRDALDGAQYRGALLLGPAGPGAALEAQFPDDTGSSLLRGEYGRPYWDFLQGLVSEGTRDRISAGRNQIFSERWSGRIEVGFSRYGLDGDRDVGRAATASGELRFTLDPGRPNWSLAYLLDGEYPTRKETRFRADGSDYRPLPLTDREVHALTLNLSAELIERRVDGFLTFDGYLGYGKDRYGSAGPLLGATLTHADGPFQLQLRANYVQGIGRSGDSGGIFGGYLQWLF